MKRWNQYFNILLSVLGFVFLFGGGLYGIQAFHQQTSKDWKGQRNLSNVKKPENVQKK